MAVNYDSQRLWAFHHAQKIISKQLTMLKEISDISQNNSQRKPALKLRRNKNEQTVEKETSKLRKSERKRNEDDNGDSDYVENEQPSYRSDSKPKAHSHPINSPNKDPSLITVEVFAPTQDFNTLNSNPLSSFHSTSQLPQTLAHVHSDLRFNDKRSSRSEVRILQQALENRLGLKEFQYHRVIALKRTSRLLVAIQRTVLGYDFCSPIGRVVLHTRFALSKKPILPTDIRKLTADVGELFVLLGSVHPKKDPLMMKLDVEDRAENRTRTTHTHPHINAPSVICAVADGTACMCYRRALCHSASAFTIDDVYRNGRTYYVFGFGRFNTGKTKSSSSPQYTENCLLVLFDGHFIWVHSDLICSISFVWSETPNAPICAEIEKNFELIRAESDFRFFSSFKQIEETFRPCDAPIIPLKKETEKFGLTLNHLQLDQDQLRLTHVRPRVILRKSPIIYSDKQRKKYAVLSTPRPPAPPVLDSHTHDGLWSDVNNEASTENTGNAKMKNEQTENSELFESDISTDNKLKRKRTNTRGQGNVKSDEDFSPVSRRRLRTNSSSTTSAFNILPLSTFCENAPEPPEAFDDDEYASEKECTDKLSYWAGKDMSSPNTRGLGDEDMLARRKASTLDILYEAMMEEGQK